MRFHGVNKDNVTCVGIRKKSVTMDIVKERLVQKYKDEDTQNHNFACWSVWVWNLVAHIEGGM